MGWFVFHLCEGWPFGVLAGSRSHHFKLRARGGDIGNAREFYFDDVLGRCTT
jgi:hypothetical protein